MSTKAPILAATYWKSNAELIEACAKLRFIRKSDLILDPTFGKGIWWKRWMPRNLIAHDLAMDGLDFRNLPYKDGTFDTIAFDPPYVSMGGRESSKIKAFYARYGLLGAPTSPALLQALINDGLTEMFRLVRWNGIVLVKVQDYVSSGKLWSGTYETEKHALELGFTVVDKLIHVKKSAGPQPPNRTRKDGTKSRQKHARHNASIMMVLQAAA